MNSAECIYCEGPILDSIQKSGLFEDCKTFVDMPMKYSSDKILNEFSDLVRKSGSKPSIEQLGEFVKDNFYELGHELETYDPNDWTDSPSILHIIKDGNMKEWASQLNNLWKHLGKKMKTDSQDMTSLIYVPHPFIVPGSRFREFYYWDTYWVISGLLLCDMQSSVNGMLQNLLFMVEKYGMVPNGGRIYYTTRSQPPLLTPMVERYYESTSDLKFVIDNLHLLEREYEFWDSKRTLEVKKNGVCHRLSHYQAGSDWPRPEGYSHDLKLAEGLSADESKLTYKHIASACESGWDFSTRWFKDYTNMTSICTTDIIPVDLNAFLAWNERILSKLCHLTGNPKHASKASFYQEKYEARCKAIHDLMWNEECGCWFDLDISIEGGRQRQAYYISNLVPLFTDIYPTSMKKHIVSKCLQYIQKNGLAEFPGGVPTSLTPHTGQQWDFPNAWPPNVHMLIEGLRLSGITPAVDMSKSMAQTWLKSNYLAWKQQNAMLEKYNCETCGAPGGGGEYDLQTGFGWTNGVVLMLLDKFNDLKTS